MYIEVTLFIKIYKYYDILLILYSNLFNYLNILIINSNNINDNNVNIIYNNTYWKLIEWFYDLISVERLTKKYFYYKTNIVFSLFLHGLLSILFIKYYYFINNNNL